MILIRYTESNNYNTPNTCICDYVRFDKKLCYAINFDYHNQEHIIEKIEIDFIHSIEETIK